MTKVVNFIKVFWGHIALGLGSFFVLYPCSPVYNAQPYRDSGVFLYIGWRILSGEIPYKDIWDHKPPVIHFINAFGLWIGDGSRWGVWVIELLFLIVASILCFKMLKNNWGITPAIFSMFLFFTSLFFLIHGGNLTTEYSLLFQFAALWLVFIAETKKSYHNYYFVGFLGALAFFTKQNTIGIWMAIFIYLIVKEIRQKEWKVAIKKVLMCLSGGMIVLFILISYFLYHEALFEFWNAAFLYNFTYASPDVLTRIKSILTGLTYLGATGMAQFALIGFCVALVVSSKFLRQSRSELLSIALISLPIELFLVSLTGRNYDHYYISLLPVFTIFSCFSFWLIIDNFREINVGLSRNIFTILVLLSLSGVIIKGYYKEFRSYRVDRHLSVINYVNRNTSEKDYVLFWGAESGYNFITKRISPTRFVYQYPLYQKGYGKRKIVYEFVRDLIENKPKIIIDTKNEKAPIFEIPAEESVNRFLKTYIESKYSKEDIGKWVVYSLCMESEN